MNILLVPATLKGHNILAAQGEEEENNAQGGSAKQ
jgi:hypothetical protein